ncbi:MAG: hypothetical protein CVV22_02420 [Ignavibacteriae bacterium HGW-Ignavibacteriae-1]|nr:MAG: hypothetical protein CVV22_02420 [Ignavibacteriae bacterium HGW-Ignavibacteriae-1]
MKLFIILCAMALITTDASAQGFLNKLKNKAIESATKKTEERIEKKMDEKIDEGLDEAEDSMKSNQESTKQDEDSDAAAARMMSKMFGGGADVKLPENYNFDGYFAMETETVQGDKRKLNTKMKMHLDKSGDNVGMEIIEADGKKMDEKAKSFMIFDNELKSMVTLTQSGDMNMAMIMNLEGFADMADSLVEEKSDNVKINKTGKTKSILGYNCDNYIIESEDGTTDAWISHEIKMSTFKAFQFLQSQQKKKNSPYSSVRDGFVLEAETTLKGEKDKTVMRVTEVNLNKKTNISTKGYTVMNLGNMGK